jgi:uncharacterized protein with gpF-like domain
VAKGKKPWRAKATETRETVEIEGWWKANAEKGHEAVKSQRRETAGPGHWVSFRVKGPTSEA